MATYVKESNNRREIGDDFSGRIYAVEWKCAECREWENEEEVVWVNDKPYHVDCAPEEPEEGYCPKCGQHFFVHNSDGGCVED